MLKKWSNKKLLSFNFLLYSVAVNLAFCAEKGIKYIQCTVKCCT